MAALRLIHETGKRFDCAPLHGRYCTINMTGQDVDYARVGIISSGEHYILFQFRGRLGLAAKAFVRDIREVRMTERMLKKESALLEQPWDEADPFALFMGERCDIHMHQGRMFEATPGFFRAKVLSADRARRMIRIRENSEEFYINVSMICGMMQSAG